MTDQQQPDLKEARTAMREEANKLLDLIRITSIGEAERAGWSMSTIYALQVLANDEDEP